MGYELIWEPKGVVKRFFGDVDGDQLLKSAAETEGDPRFDEYHYVINDFLACESFSAPLDVVEEVAAIDGAAALINKRIKIAIVATLPGVLAAAEQYVKAPYTSYPTRIFSTLDNARDWIGKPSF